MHDKVRLDQILKRYDSTPFDVTPKEAVAVVLTEKGVIVRAWSKRPKAKTAARKDAKAADQFELFIELTPVGDGRFASSPKVSFPDSLAPGLQVLKKPAEIKPARKTGDEKKGQNSRRFVSRLSQKESPKRADVTVPMKFQVAMVVTKDSTRTVEGQIASVVPVGQTNSKTSPDAAKVGVALVGGTLDMTVGHLCDQKGCVDHFYRSIRDIPGLAAVRPHPSLKSPRATGFVRAKQAVDIWKLREKLRDRGVEIAAVVPRDLPPYRLRIELPRWLRDAKSTQAEQCLVCRQQVIESIAAFPWSGEVKVAGGGINLRTERPDIDLIELLDAISDAGVSPKSVWLVPDGARMPKSAPPQLAGPTASAKQGGSQAHPRIRFDFPHVCEVGHHILTPFGKPKWVSGSRVESNKQSTTVTASIGDRQYANLTGLLNEYRTAGRFPQQIRLSGFGDIRIQFRFAHVCGEVDYSKPPKPKKKKNKDGKKKDKGDVKKKSQKTPDAKKEQPASKSNQPSQQTTKDADKDAKASTKKKNASTKDTKKHEKDEKEKKDKKKAKKPKKKKPFVPKPVRPAKSSNGRKAIEDAIASVGWVKQATFHKYHTKTQFKGPKKLMLSLQARGEDVVRLDEMIQALRRAGFPPVSVSVSRLFPGIMFGQPLTEDLELTDGDGKKRVLSASRQGDRPLAVAFVSVNCPKWKKYKYKAETQHFKQLKQTIESYKDRVDFVAVSANSEDKYPDVVDFLKKAGVQMPVLHDTDGRVRKVFNAQTVPPPPHLFIFDSGGLLRYIGEPHDNWNKPEQEKKDYLDQALKLVLAGKYQANGAVFYNRPQCNCAAPKCKCPKCGCGPTCRCSIKH